MDGAGQAGSRAPTSGRLRHALGVAAWLGVIDERVGAGLDGLVRAHHRRRLSRLGWARVLVGDEDDRAPAGGRPLPPDSSTSTGFAHPVRQGNAVRVHIDGDDALAAIAKSIAGAKSFVHIAGWFASPGFRLTREPDAPALRDLLAGVAQRADVRLLLWGGPPLPVFRPTRAMAEEACAGFTERSEVRCVLDRRERTMHCHHEKLVIVDGEVAFVGGIDLTDLAGDRRDSPLHLPNRPLGWHDVATELRGPIVADVAEHFAQRWREASGEDLATAAATTTAPPAAGQTAVQLARTVPERTYRFAPRGDFSILEQYLNALRSAESLVYLENQFLWSTEVVDVLARKLRRPPTEDFRVLLVLPARPSTGADTSRGQLGRLLDADDGHRRVLATTVSALTEDRVSPVLVYVHAKVGIVDDAWLTIGSANLNEHSLFNDTEVNVVVHDPALARATRLRLWSEHLQRPEGQIGGEPARVIDELWRPIAEDQARRERNGEPRTHRLALLPNVSRHAERLQGPLRGLLVDG
ncbi:MAG TPA: phospholipase D family protein [Actinocrinis sp.]|nr:phospholipase D family protein [Actinocrinis sp.]